MRIVCPTIAEFLDNLRAAKALYEDTVWCSTVRGPVDNEDRHNAAVFQVVFQASAVVVVSEGASDYLVDFGEKCGNDYEDATQERPGSERAAELRRLITEYVGSRGWRVLPGIIDGV